MKMEEIRSGVYSVYKNQIFGLSELSKNDYELISRNDSKNKFEKWGFKKYNDSICFLPIEKKNIVSAFHVSTFCKHNGLKFTLDGAFRENEQTYRIWPVFESFDKLGLDHRDDNTHYWVKEQELDEIWEEREKISGFPFKVKKLNWLKSKNSL